MQLTIGTDVEFFIVDKDGKIVPSQGLLGTNELGTKRNPILTMYGTLQRDNVAVEFATPVCKTCEEFIAAIRMGIINALNYLPEGHSLLATPSVNFEKEQLEHPEAGQFGCDPDFSAWSKGRKNKKPYSADPTLRSAGMHIHCGHSCLDTKENKIRFIQWMDYCFLPSIFIDHSPASIKRKELYGKVGAYRPTSYGAEYRSLSNIWAASPVYAELAYYLTLGALCKTYSMRDAEDYMWFDAKTYRKAFNDCDIGTAVVEFYSAWNGNMDFLPSEGFPILLDQFVDRALTHKLKDLKTEWRIK